MAHPSPTGRSAPSWKLVACCITILIGCIVAARPIAAQQSATAALQGLERADSALGAAWSGRQLDQMVSFYADDAKAMWTADSVRTGRTQIRDMWRDRWADPAFRIVGGARDVMQLSAGGDMAYMQGRSSFTWTRNGAVVTNHGTWVTVWVLRAGEWRILSEVWNQLR